MRTIAVLTLPALLLFWSSSCKSSDHSGREPLLLLEEEEEQQQQQQQRVSLTRSADASTTVALVMVTIANPFFVSMEKGARRAERELGIRLLALTAANDISVEQQTASVRQVIRDKADAMVIVPGRSAEMVSVIKEARDTGIVVINIDNRLDSEMSEKMGLTDIPFVGVDNEQGAYLSAQYLGSKLSGSAQVAIIGGDPAAQAAKDREQGALRAFAEFEHIEVVAMESAYWRIDEAYQATARLFERHPNIGGIFCANDLMALGVIRYLDETSKDHVLVAAYDGIAEAYKAIRRGRLIATVDQRPDEQGYLGVKYALRALAGENLPAETFIDVELVTIDTLQQDVQ